jgi:TfoX/Sxy family transcriptional regulator of competence genes
MAYDEYLADRIRRIYQDLGVSFEEKKMMGGVCHMVKDKMCTGVVKNELMVRINPEIQDEALKRKGSREMDFTHQSMKGFLFIDPLGTDMDSDLEYWIKLALDFNPLAKASKKKKS